MALYNYQAVAADGVPQDGSMEAGSEAQVIENLNKLGLIPLQVFVGGGDKTAPVKKARKAGLFGSKRISQPDIVAFTQQLSSMLKA